jgi:hypothetical protein
LRSYDVKKLIFIATACVAALSGFGASAQDFFTPAINVTFDFASQSALTSSVNQANSDTMRQLASNAAKNEGVRASSTPRSSGVIASAVQGTTTYSRSASRTRANLASFIAQRRRLDRAAADEMERQFASTDIFGAMEGAMAPYGLRIDNVADAYAAYWINAWESSQGIVRSQETRARVQAVKTQASNVLLATPAFANATDSQKQEFAEALLLQAIMISSLMEDAASDPVKLRAVANAVRTGAKASGIDLETMRLTPTGFVPN